MAKLEKDALIDAICNLTLLEAADIVKALEEKLGVSAAAPVAVAALRPVVAVLPPPSRRRLNSPWS